MTCIVLVKNPQGGVLAIGDDDEIAEWPNAEAAEAGVEDQPFVRAWGGYVVDLDNLDVTLV